MPRIGGDTSMKRSLVRGVRRLVLLLSAIAAGGCESTSVTAVEIVVVSVNPPQIIIFVNDTEQLSARPQDASGSTLQGRTVVWSSTNPNIASVSAAGLVRGLNAGSATIRATAEGVSGSASVTVIQRPQIVLSPSEVQFESEFAGAPTPTVPVGVTNGIEGTLSGLDVDVSYSPTGPQGWVEAELTSTTAPATVNIRVLPELLPSGIHEASVQISSSVAGNSPQMIRVVLQVGEAPPTIEVSSEVVSFASDAGQADPPPQGVSVTNAGGGVLSGLQAVVRYEPGSGAGWLQAVLTGPTAPAQLTISVDPQGLIPGVYDAVISLTATTAPGPPVDVDVRFRFGTPPPEIELLPASLELEILEATPVFVPPSVSVGNRGTGTLGNLSIQVMYGPGDPTGWLQAVLDSNTAPTNVQLLVSDTGFLPGEYLAELIVSSPDAINSPQSVEILLTVLPRPSLVLSTITPVPAAIVADGLDTSTIEVQLNDLRGNPITTGQHEVTLSATAGVLGPVVNNLDGTYTAILTSTTLAQQSTISGTVNGQALLAPAIVDFVAGPPDPALSTIDAAATSIVADGVETSL